MGADRPARDLSNTMSGVLLACLRRRWGDDMVERVLELAAETRPLAEIEDPVQWSSYEQTGRLFRAAIDATAELAIARLAGEELLRHYADSEVIAMLQSLGQPAAVMRLVADVAAKQSTITTFECLEDGDDYAVISSVIRPDLVRQPMWCAYTAGVFSSIPVLFGLELANVTELECQTRGDLQCLYRITWDPSPVRGPEGENVFLREQVAALTSRFEALEHTAVELASVGEIDEVLHTIITRASVAVRAPHYVLAVRLPGDERPRVHCVGIEDGDVVALADEILADEPDDHGGARLVVDIAAATQWFGRLAVLQPDGSRFVDEERRLLMAYAGHAAAALQTAAALGETRKQVQTLGALLDLSSALADVTSREEAASRLAQSLPKVLDCAEASVSVWYPDDRLLVLQGHSNRSTPAAEPETSQRRGRPGTVMASEQLVETLIGTLRPIPFGPRAGDRALRHLGEVSGFAAGTVTAVTARGELFGVIVVPAPADTDVSSTQTTRDRLPGVAALAATAFATAKLLDQVRYQAYHDPLTGLPNLRALERLAPTPGADGADDTRKIGILFVDIDRFKHVNDDFGHATGDQLLIEVGRRLQRAVRGGDTVIRIGGDEFAVVLPDLRNAGEATVVADRLLRSVMAPFELGGHELNVSVSIGVAVDSMVSATLDDLLSRSDAAMYRAKTAGRAAVCVDGASE